MGTDGVQLELTVCQKASNPRQPNRRPAGFHAAVGATQRDRSREPGFRGRSNLDRAAYTAGISGQGWDSLQLTLPAAAWVVGK
jgi:hypothetical protein